MRTDFHSNKAMPWYNVSRILNSTSLDACYNGDAMNETECVSSGAPEYAPFFDCKCSGSVCVFTRSLNEAACAARPG